MAAVRVGKECFPALRGGQEYPSAPFGPKKINFGLSGPHCAFERVFDSIKNAPQELLPGIPAHRAELKSSRYPEISFKVDALSGRWNLPEVALGAVRAWSRRRRVERREQQAVVRQCREV